jgi:dTDP-4-dehydrorhamnose 3,5-epimerase
MTQLPDGVVCRNLVVHRDDRGWISEIFRQEWPTGVAPVQWNAVRSMAGVLRGVHVHVRHTAARSRPSAAASRRGRASESEPSP